MNLKSSNKVDTNRYELTITIDENEFEQAVAKAYKMNIKNYNIPGFRKGKAPRGVIEKMYGKGVFYEEAFNEISPKVIEDAANEAELEIVDYNDIEFDVKSIDEKGVEFSVKVTVKPEVEIGEYKGLKAEKPSVEATQEDVDKEIEQMRERASRMVTVDNRAAQNDDIVVFDFEGFVDGESFEGGKAESYSLKLGSGQFIPGFEEQIIGHNTEDEFDVNVTFPEDYQAENLKGKEAVFKCKLHEIKVRELPLVDNEFVKDVSEFDTIEDLQEDLKKNISQRKEKEAETSVESQLIDALISDMKAEIPQAMIEGQINQNLREMEYSLQMQGLNLKQYMSYTGATLDTLKENYKEQSEKQVKIRLALEQVAKLEAIEPTKEEIDTQYEEYAASYKMEVDKVKAVLPEIELVKDLKVKKASELINEEAKITISVN